MKQLLCLPALLVAFLCSSTFAQDSISLINGKSYTGRIVSFSNNDSRVGFAVPGKKKPKLKSFDKQDVFSVHFRDSADVVLYFLDADLGNEMTVGEMEAFVRGEQFATRYYHCRWVIPVGAVAGVGGLYWGFWGLSVPAAYFGVVAATSVSVKNKKYLKEEDLKDEYFVQGFKYKAKRKKLNNAIIGGLAGAAVMGAVSAVITGLYYFD